MPNKQETMEERWIKFITNQVNLTPREIKLFKKFLIQEKALSFKEGRASMAEEIRKKVKENGCDSYNEDCDICNISKEVLAIINQLENEIETNLGDVLPHVCEFGDEVYMSNPPQVKCKKCGKFEVLFIKSSRG